MKVLIRPILPIIALTCALGAGVESFGNPLGFWRFNEGAGVTAADSVGTNDATLQNGAGFGAGQSGVVGDFSLNLGAAGNFQRAFVDATNNFLDPAATNNQITVSFWQRANDATSPNSSSFWAQSPLAGGGQRGAQAHVPWSNGTVFWDTGGCCPGSTRLTVGGQAGTIKNGQWHHFAFVKNGNNKQIWLDGALIANQVGSATAPLLPFSQLWIGSAVNGGDSYNGFIDDFSVYDTALGAASIQALANGDFYLTSSGDWGTGGNWDAGVKPIFTDNAFIGGGLTGTVSATEAANNLTVGHNGLVAPGNGTLNVTDTLDIGNDITLGAGGTTGNINVSGGGTLNVDGNITTAGGGTGSVNLNNATLGLGNGSTVSSNISTAGTGGFIDVATGDSATITGTITGGNLFKTGDGAVTSDGNTVNIGGFRQSEGTVSLQNSPNWNLSGGLIVADNRIPGVSGSNTNAIFNIDSGSLTAQFITMGDRDTHTVTGQINQSGGTVTTTGATAENNGLRLGHWPSTNVTYNLSGGTLIIGDNRDLSTATDGTGTFNQTGGEAFSQRVVVNKRANNNGNGTFRVQGGVFNLGSGGIINDFATAPYLIEVGGAGGTLKASASWSSSLNMTLFGGGANSAMFDTNGFGINLSGNLTGGGGLVKRGDGTLTLTGNSTLGNVLVQRDTGNSTLTFDGGGTSSATFVGVGNPLNIGGQTGTATLVVNDHTLSVNGNLFLGERAGHAGHLDQTAGTIGVTGQIRVGHWPNETSTYDMTGGVLNSSGGLFVGWDGGGIMNVTGSADVNATGNAIVQRSSTLTIGGNSTFDTPFMSIGDQRGLGHVVQNGGTATVGEVRLGHWAAGAGSTYDISAGQLNAGTLSVGWDGANNTMNISGTADVNVGGTTLVQNNTTLNISGASTLDMNFFSIGDQRGVGHVDQTGGTVTVTGPNGVRVGHWPAGSGSTYDMTGGQLNTTVLAVGWDGVGDMNVGGNADVNVAGTTTIWRNSELTIGGNATFDTNFFAVGDDPRGPGTLTIEGNANVTTNNLFVGEGNGVSGTVNQNGGALTVNGGLRVGHWPNEVSTYNMSGGTLDLTATTGGQEGPGTLAVGIDGTGVFNQTGGAINAYQVHLNSRFNGLGGTSTYDLTGGSLDIGAGGLTGNVSGSSNFVFTLGGTGVLDLQDNDINLPESATRFSFVGGTLQDVNLFNGPLNQDGGLLRIGAENPTFTTRDIMTVAGDYNQSAGVLEIDIFGPGSHGFNGESGSGLAIDPLDPNLDSDLLHVMGDAALDGTLAINLNGFEPAPFAFYDVLLADGTIDADDLTLTGVNLFRVIDNPFGPGQLLQVAVPEPASFALWALLGALGIASFARLRRKK